MSDSPTLRLFSISGDSHCRTFKNKAPNSYATLIRLKLVAVTAKESYLIVLKILFRNYENIALKTYYIIRNYERLF